MKILELIYTLWPVWAIASALLGVVMMIKTIKSGFESLGAATSSIGSKEMEKYKKNRKLLDFLCAFTLVVFILLFISIAYYVYTVLSSK